MRSKKGSFAGTSEKMVEMMRQGQPNAGNHSVAEDDSNELTDPIGDTDALLGYPSLGGGPRYTLIALLRSFRP